MRIAPLAALAPPILLGVAHAAPALSQIGPGRLLFPAVTRVAGRAPSVSPSTTVRTSPSNSF